MLSQYAKTFSHQFQLPFLHIFYRNASQTNKKLHETRFKYVVMLHVYRSDRI